MEALFGRTSELLILPREPGVSPSLRGMLRRPAVEPVSLVLSVHSSAGIPLAYAAVRIPRGERSFETPHLTFLGLEGYAHLSNGDVRHVEERMWSRRAFVTAAYQADASRGRLPS